jgi:hypothetical protein
MELYAIFGQRKCSYAGEHAPELLDCWDDGSRDENPDGFDKALDGFRRSTEFTNVVVVAIGVDGRAIDKALNEPLRLEASTTLPPRGAV